MGEWVGEEGEDGERGEAEQRPGSRGHRGDLNLRLESRGRGREAEVSQGSGRTQDPDSPGRALWSILSLPPLPCLQGPRIILREPRGLWAQEGTGGNRMVALGLPSWRWGALP